MDEYYFVWIRGLDGRPKPQIWDADQFSGPEWKFTHVMARHPLDARVRRMGLDRLAKLFPAPGLDELA